MKITVLTFDLSKNSLGRVYILVKTLEHIYDIEVVGFMSGKNIWEPLKNEKSISYKFVRFNKGSISVRKIKELYNKVDGDVIYLAKPIFYSFTIALFQKIFRKKPLIIDIDDWQFGFFLDSYKRKYKKLTSKMIFILKEPLRFFSNPNKSFLWSMIIERMISFADQITVSNNLLKRKFGGIVVCHGRDVAMLDPTKFNRRILIQKYGLDDKGKIIMFFGTIRRHKGLEVLIKGVSMIKNIKVILVIVGVDHKDKYCNDLISYGKKELGEKLKIFGMQAFEKVPEFISIADVIVIPQLYSYSSIYQTPAKVFDAMAMAKPIIATNVSDLPEILNGCGLIIETENTQQLADSLIYILKHKKEAEKIGLKAREKFIKEYSFYAMEGKLENIFNKYIVRCKSKDKKVIKN
jgi:glycosyltransferase involved in cell wall biosynthesis